MGSLLIVDDEPDILETLEELFKYESGLEIDVHVAKSARAAVELLEQSKFDVVMTDIKMPGMSGIELFHLIKENWPKCRVIFLTGYRDFDDLYEIMGNKDVRYLLKSEEYDVLVRTVAEAFQEIEDMMQSEIRKSRQQKDIQQAQMILRRNYLKESFRSGDLKQEKLNQIGIPLLLEKPLFIFLARLDWNAEHGGYEESLERECVLHDTIQEFLPVRMKEYLYYDTKGYYLIFFQPEHVLEEQIPARTWKRFYTNLTGALEYIQEKLLKSASLSVSFVTCDERCCLKDGRTYLNRLKQEALCRIGNGEQRIVMAKSQLPERSLQEMPVNYQLQIKHLEEFLEAGKYGEFLVELRKMTDVVADETERGTVKEAAEVYYSVSMLLLRTINVNHLKSKIQEELSLDQLLEMEKLGSGGAAAEYLNSVANAIIHELEAEGRSRSSEVLEKVTLYIDRHLADDLTLTRLAGFCYLNPSYLSRLFKQAYGCNITEYISKKRLEQAKKLLIHHTDRIQEVSAKVGYLSVPSFNRIFKKETGMSPVEYRDRYGVKNHEIQ